MSFNENSMSGLKQRLYKHELAKIGFPNAEYFPDSDKIKLQPGNDRLPEINNSGDIRYGTEYSQLVFDKINLIVNMVNEITAAWENSRPAPFEEVSNFNILCEYNNIVIAARDDEKYGRSLHFVTWKYNDSRTEFHSGVYTDDYASAKESFALRSGLIKEEKVISREQAADIKAAINFVAENSGGHDLNKRLNDINDDLCTAYPDINTADKQRQENERESGKDPKAKPAVSEKPDKKPTLQEKIERAKQAVREADAQKDSADGKRRSRNGQEVE